MGSGPFIPTPEIDHVCFGGHYVTVSSTSPVVTADFRSAFGAMLTRGPSGTPAGHFEVRPTRDGIRILGAEFADPQPIEDPAEAAHALYHAAVTLLMLARQDLLWLHAGVAALGNRAYVFCGPSGQGKSTLVGALLDRGWTYMSDEVAAIDATGGTIHPFPVTPRRRVSEGVMLEDIVDVRRLPKITVDLPAAAIGRQPIPIAGMYFLRYSPTAGAIRESPCSPAQAVLEMLQNSLSISAEREREIALLARLASRVPGIQINYAHPEEAAGHVDAAVSARPA